MEHMFPEEIARLKLRYMSRDGSAEVLCSKAWAHITLQDAEIARLKTEVSNLRGTVRLHKERAEALTARVEELEGALERIDRIEVYDEDARETLRAKLGVMRDIARAAREGK